MRDCDLLLQSERAVTGTGDIIKGYAVIFVSPIEMVDALSALERGGFQASLVPPN